MSDWRLEGPSTEFLKGKILKKIVFPDFWDSSYATGNDFYKEIKADSEAFVKRYNRGKEYLEGEKIQDFWHSHCIFCTDSITTRDKRVCYCADNYSIWICQNCFDDFHSQFSWIVMD